MSNFDQAIALLEKGGDGATLSPNSKSEKKWAELEKIVNNHHQDKYVFGPNAEKLLRKAKIIVGALFGASALCMIAGAMSTGLTALLFLILGMMVFGAGTLLSPPSSFMDKHKRPSPKIKHKICSMIGYHNMNPQPEKSGVYSQLMELYNQNKQNQYFWDCVVAWHDNYLSTIEDTTDEFVEIVMTQKEDDSTVLVVSPPKQAKTPSPIDFKL